MEKYKKIIDSSPTMAIKKKKIIIIGAGIAGLAAANALMPAGFEVILLEARNRYGGRIEIDHSLGMPLSRGAGWMHGATGNPVTQLASQFPTPLFFMEDKKFYAFSRYGECIEDEKIKSFNKKIELAIERSRRWAVAQKNDIALSTALSSALSTQDLSFVEQDLFERKLRFFENYMGAEYELLSACYWDEEESLPGGHAFLGDSYEAILNGLASFCSIQLNTLVEAIHERSNDIAVLTNKGVWCADAVIVTLPLGVLKQQQVKFQPALSGQKQKAIDCLGMGLFNIIGMRFAKRFCPADCRAFFLPGSSTCSMFFNVGCLSDAPIILGYTGGKTASTLESEDEREVIEKIRLKLEKFFKQDIPFPEHYFITRWSQDPFSLGSYSYLPVGAAKDHRAMLGQPESDRLFFAGEATHLQYPATVHGAYLSGIREAEKVKKLYCC